MARAPFNRTVDVYAGVGTATPGVFKRTITARVVRCTRNTMTTPAGLQFSHYVTYTGTSLVAGDETILPPVVSLDLSFADVLEVPSLGLVGGVVIWNELIVPPGSRPPYRKSYVLF